MLYILSFMVAFGFEGIGNERFSVFYPPGFRVQAELTLSYLEDYYRLADRNTGNRPGRLMIVIEDIGTESNGYTDPVAAAVHLYTNIPYPDFHFGAMRSWWRTVSVHEYTHYSHLTNVRGLVRCLRYPLGKVWLPNAFSALYMYEGVTVLVESSLLPYEGRLQEGYYDVYTNLRAGLGRLPSQNYLAHVPDEYPDGDAPYLFGSEFTRFLSKQATLGSRDGTALAQYYTDYGGCCPLNLFGWDHSAKKIWGRNRNELYRAWRRQAVREARFGQVPGRIILTGRYLTHPAAAAGELYVCRQVMRPLAHDFMENYMELLQVDPMTGASRTVLTGNINLPVRVDGEDLYVAVRDLRPGKKNFALYGHGYVSSVYRIHGRTRTKLYTGEIKTFAVRDGDLYYVLKNGLGSDLYLNDEVYFHFANLLVQDMAFRDNGDLVFIGYREADGNNLYVLTADRAVRQLTDQDFSFSGLTVQGQNAFFSANAGHAWLPYRLDLETGEVFRLSSDDLAAYPVPYQGKLYYITIQANGEALKEVDVAEEPADWPKQREPILLPTSVACRPVSVWANIRPLLWPDASLPFYYPAAGDEPAYGGLLVVGHDALGFHEYNALLTYDSTFHYDAVWGYHAFPALTATFRLNDQEDDVCGLVDLLCWLRERGGFRQISLSTAYYPYPRDLDARLNLRLQPGRSSQVNLYGAGYFSFAAGQDPGFRAGFAYYQPAGIGLLVTQVQTGYQPDSLAVKFPSGAEIEGMYGAKAGVRFTAPILAPRWGIDFPHLFIERIWVTLEGQAGIACDRLGNAWTEDHYNVLGYLTANMSILNGFFKIRPSFGGVYDPVADEPLTPYFSVTADLLGLLDRMNERSRARRSIDDFPITPLLPDR